MRLGLVIYGSLDQISGGYLYDRQIIGWLERFGHEVEQIGLPWRSYGQHLGDNLSRQLYRRLKLGCWDALLQDELNHPSLFLTNRRLQRGANCPLISIVHHLRSSEPHPMGLIQLYAWVERRYLETIDAFVYNSHPTRKVVSSIIGHRPGLVAPPGRDHIAPLGSRSEVLARLRREGPLRLLFVGNLIPRKGLHTVLEALIRIDPNSWQLTVIGSLETDPAYARSVVRMLKELGIADRVTLLGAQPPEHVAAWLSRSDVFVMPSWYEGFGIAYLEAMGHGVPPIGTACGGASDLIEDGVDGYLVAPGSPEILAERLLELSQDRDRLQEMSLRARARYEAQPTWEDSARRVSYFIEEIVNQRSHNGPIIQGGLK